MKKMFPSDTELDTKITLETESRLADDTPPFHILFLGNWTGKSSLSQDSINSRPIEIDRDNFDDVMKKFGISLVLNFQSDDKNTLALEFRELDDFHPDNIFRRLALFNDLRDLRQKLKNPNTFNQAAKEVRSWFSDNEPEINNSTVSTEINQPAPGDLLDQILFQSDESLPQTNNQSTGTSALSVLIGKLVEPHLIQTDIEEQSKLLMIVDEVISDLMRNILHHPQFQELESAWRGLYLLVRHAETNDRLKIFLLDVSKPNLIANLKSTNDLSESKLHRILVDEAADPWAVVCGNYTFELNVDDAAALIRLAKIGNVANTPFISHIKPQMFGFDTFNLTDASDSWKFSDDSTEGKLWATLRSISEANYLGLILPRFLARLPYGEKTEPTEVFSFEEFTSKLAHEKFLWANPSFICALLLAQTYQKFEWDITNNLMSELNNLPIYLYQEANETKTKSATEIVMTQANCERLSDQGLMPLISFRNSDKVRLWQFQSIASPARRLAGHWG